MEKTAICTHCGTEITFNVVTGSWEHDMIQNGTNYLTCVKIEFATPKRGTVMVAK